MEGLCLAGSSGGVQSQLPSSFDDGIFSWNSDDDDVLVIECMDSLLLTEGAGSWGIAPTLPPKSSSSPSMLENWLLYMDSGRLVGFELQPLLFDSRLRTDMELPDMERSSANPLLPPDVVDSANALSSLSYREVRFDSPGVPLNLLGGRGGASSGSL